MRSSYDPRLPAREETLGRDEREIAGPHLLERDIFVRAERYELNPDQARLLFDVGRFRTVRRADLESSYEGEDKTRFEQALRSLANQKLLMRRTLTAPNSGERLQVLLLSRTGKELLERAMEETGQRFYAKLVKPREVIHDTAVYRMFQLEAERISKEGGSVRRVVLDYELKRNIFSALEKGKRRGDKAHEALQAEVADRFRLKVIDGKIPLPDLRIEYRTAEGQEAHIDLELSTGHYKSDQLAVKARAGFHFYHLAPGRSSRSGATPYGQDVLREIFSR